jgi:DNA replication protein DnaC
MRAPKLTRKVDVDRTCERLAKLDLARAADVLTEHLSKATKEELAPHRFLDRLLDDEITHREERRIKTSLKLSGLPIEQTQSTFDSGFQPAVERSRIETLATCGWILERESLLIQGPPGVGKSHLAVALGVRAVEKGFSVAFLRLEDLLAAMKRDADMSPLRLRRRKYTNVALLINERSGLRTDEPHGGEPLFQMVSYRHGRSSTLIT